MDNPIAPIPSISPQPAVEPEVSTPSESSSRRWLLWSAIGLTLLIFGIAIGAFSAKFISESQRQTQLTSTPTPTLSPTPTLIPDPTANWKTYTNKMYGYGLKYSPSSFIEESGNKVTVWENRDKQIPAGTEAPPKTPYVAIEVTDLSGGVKKIPITIKDVMRLTEEAGNEETNKLISTSEITLNSIDITEYTYEFSPNGIRWYPLYFQHGDFAFRITSQKQYSKSIGTGDFFDQILSTFKFLD